jgi:predicted RNA-binding protein with RPS1 domain
MVGIVEKGNIMLVESINKVQTINVDMEIKIIEANEKLNKIQLEMFKKQLENNPQKNYVVNMNQLSLVQAIVGFTHVINQNLYGWIHM